MRCKTCAKEFIPARKNVLNYFKCIIFLKAKTNQKEHPLEKNQKVNKIMMTNHKVNMMMKKLKI